MKKKVFIIASLCALGLCHWNAKASIPQQIYFNLEHEDNHIPSEAEQIKLQGKLDYSANPDDIEAGATETSVYIYFNKSYGSVSISLFDAEGNLCYSSVVNTGVQQMVVIPITGNSQGTYTVELDNVVGFAEGYFEPKQH